MKRRNEQRRGQSSRNGDEHTGRHRGRKDGSLLRQEAVRELEPRREEEGEMVRLRCEADQD